MELFIHNLIWNIQMFGRDPISTLIIGFIGVDLIVVSICLIKIAMISAHEREGKKVNG